MGLDRRDGLVITEVKPGSAADEAGLQPGDLITQVNRRPVKNLADYKREMAGEREGQVGIIPGAPRRQQRVSGA